MEQKRAKEDSDALFLIQRSHFLVTSVVNSDLLITCTYSWFVGAIIMNLYVKKSKGEFNFEFVYTSQKLHVYILSK